MAVCVFVFLPMSIQTAMKNQQHKNSFSLRTFFSELDRKLPLSSFVYDKSEGWYDAKHQSFSIDEIALVNSLEVKQCRVLPFRNDQKEREKERRNTEISLPFLRKRIQSADRKPFRFQKDSSGRMDRIPCPSFSVRKPQRIFSRQQKCTFDWAILDKKGL